MVDKKAGGLSLRDADMVTSAKVTRRSLLAGAGVALGAGAVLGGLSAVTGEAKAGPREADRGGTDKGSMTGNDASERDGD